MAIRAEDLQHFTVEEYERLCEADPVALARTELVKGVILAVSPESRLHAQAVRHVDDLLNELHGGRSWRNGSVRLDDDTLWEPDVYVLRADAETMGKYSLATDLEIAVEVCLSTQQRDLSTKLEVYATHGVPVYWAIMPTTPGWAIVHRHPSGGGYRSADRFGLPGGLESLPAELFRD